MIRSTRDFEASTKIHAWHHAIETFLAYFAPSPSASTPSFPSFPPPALSTMLLCSAILPHWRHNDWQTVWNQSLKLLWCRRWMSAGAYADLDQTSYLECWRCARCLTSQSVGESCCRNRSQTALKSPRWIFLRCRDFLAVVRVGWHF